MKYQRFEDLPVWKDAVELSAQIFVFAKDQELRGMGDAANQLERAGLLISNNVAEGFERGTTQELPMFIYYARGSAGEVRSILHVLNRMTTLAHLQSPKQSRIHLLPTARLGGHAAKHRRNRHALHERQEPRSPASPPKSGRLHDQAQDVNPASAI